MIGRQRELNPCFQNESRASFAGLNDCLCLKEGFADYGESTANLSNKLQPIESYVLFPNFPCEVARRKLSKTLYSELLAPQLGREATLTPDGFYPPIAKGRGLALLVGSLFVLWGSLRDQGWHHLFLLALPIVAVASKPS